MDKDRSLCPTGLSCESVAKLDIAKLCKPKEWGWRFLAFDFIMPNHQIVECYIVFQQMEAAKKFQDPEAEACPDLSNHEIFEKWRIEDTTKLKGDKLEEFNSDKLESNRRYNAAFGDVVRHTSKAEMAAFFEPFGVTDFSVDDFGLLSTRVASPPALDQAGWELFPEHVNDAESSLGANRNSKNKNKNRLTMNPLHNTDELGTSRLALSRNANGNGSWREGCVSTHTDGDEEDGEGNDIQGNVTAVL